MGKKERGISHQPFIQSFFFVVSSIILTYVLVQIPFFHTFIAELGSYGYIGALLGGMLFVSIFTAAPGVLLLLTLAQTHAILPLALVAGLGAVFGDYVIISVLVSEAKDKVNKLPEKDGIMKTIQLLRHSRYRFFLTILGAIIVASPLPDELGLTLMGLSKIKRSSFLWLTFILNTIGIYLLLSVVK